jgi:L-cysteine desulfidase
MFTSKENASQSASNLTQQDIQDIALSMFNLFAQNVQDQAQVRAAEVSEAVIAVAKKSGFRTSDVGFFDSQLNSSYDSGDVVQVERDLYYRDVYLFVERVKDAVIMFEAEVVRTNLSACLRGSVQVWYIEGLSDLEKKALRTLEDDVDH